MDVALRRELAQSLSMVENRAPGWRHKIAGSYASPGAALVIGVTGPPGSGKSSLIDSLAWRLAADGHRVGVIAIDPASPFSGGAVLGDRIRMRRCEESDSIFVRSMSARGHAGGLNESALDLCAVMSSHGLSHILVETVGVGQSEIEVAFLADCTLVLSAPGLGDSVQTAKAGLLEVGDIYIVNKGDLPGAPNVAQDLRNMLALVFPGRAGVNVGSFDPSMVAAVAGPARRLIENRYGAGGDVDGFWHPPVLVVSSSDDSGVPALIESIRQFDEWLSSSRQRDRRRLARTERQLTALLKQRLLDQLRNGSSDHSDLHLTRWASEVLTSGIDPHAIVERILRGEPRP